MKIPAIVICAHILLLASLLYLRPPEPKPKPRVPVAVQTYLIQEEKPKIAQPSKPVAETKPVELQPKQQPAAPKPKPVAQEKPKPAAQEKPKPAQQAKPKPKPAAQVKAEPKPHAPSKPDPNREKLKQMMQQSLASLDSSPHDHAKTEPATRQIGALASEALNFESAYQDRLAALLQSALTLPEKGDVKLSLTVTRSGSVKSVSVKNAASERNQHYVEEALPGLLLPPFENHFKGENAHTFSITLTSS